MTSIDLNNLSIRERQKLVRKEYNENKKLKKKIIEAYIKLIKQNDN